MKPRTGLPLLVSLLLALVCATSAGAAGYSEGGPLLPRPYSLGAQSARANALVTATGGRIGFAGEATANSPAFGLGGVIGPGETLGEPAAAALAEGGPLDGIAAGPDGNFWITSAQGNEILRMTPAGALTAFPVGVPGTASGALGGPTGIVAGADGALWFTAAAGDAIGRITTEGAVTAFPLAPGARPHAIAAAPDGTLWFTEAGTGEIGAITPAGLVSAYPLPDRGASPNGIALTPAGEAWFTESNSPHIGAVKASGQVVEFVAEKAGPIVFGPAGNFWFGSVNGIGSISPRGALGSTYCFDHCRADVDALTVGPSGILWYAEHQVGRGGGGGTYIAVSLLAGKIGQFLPASPDVVISTPQRVDGRGMVRIPLTCRGNAEERCRGKARLRIGAHAVAVGGFVIPVGRAPGPWFCGWDQGRSGSSRPGPR